MKQLAHIIQLLESNFALDNIAFADNESIVIFTDGSSIYDKDNYILLNYNGNDYKIDKTMLIEGWLGAFLARVFRLMFNGSSAASRSTKGSSFQLLGSTPNPLWIYQKNTSGKWYKVSGYTTFKDFTKKLLGDDAQAEYTLSKLKNLPDTIRLGIYDPKQKKFVYNEELVNKFMERKVELKDNSSGISLSAGEEHYVLWYNPTKKLLEVVKIVKNGSKYDRMMTGFKMNPTQASSLLSDVITIVNKQAKTKGGLSRLVKTSVENPNKTNTTSTQNFSNTNNTITQSPNTTESEPSKSDNNTNNTGNNNQ